jgi:hypothetical protein
MRPRAILGWVGAGASVGALACTDLFHSTSDVLDKCQLNAASCELDFCRLPPATQEAFAEHACSWLGACESPLGGNAFGACMVQARLAFDCGINQSHPVKGNAHALWECLAGVRTCADVRRCVWPGGSATCGDAQASTVCVSAGSGTARIACQNGATVAENCNLWEQTCVLGVSPATCGAGTGAGSSLDCDSGPCIGSCNLDTERVYWRSGPGEVGLDCTGNGAGQCGVFEGGAGQWPACLPEDAGGCVPALAVSCMNDIATSCPTGVTETLDCAGLLGVTGSCQEAGLDPPFDWTSPCASAGNCQESCDGGILTGCARGASFVTDCAEAGLGACHIVQTDADDAGPHAACLPPQE